MPLRANQLLRLVLSSSACSIKGIFDRYQQALGTSLWTEQYEVPPSSLPPSVSFDL
jgi:hypothetical protein